MNFVKLIKNLVICGFVIASAALFACNDDDKGEVNTLRIDPSEIEMPGSGGERTITVISSVEWKLEDTPSWITIKEQTSGSFTIEADANLDETRSGEIKVVAPGAQTQTLSIEQKKRAGIILVDKDSIGFSTIGGTETLTVLSANVEWEVDCQADWVDLDRKGNIITVTVDENLEFTDLKDFIIFSGDNVKTYVEVTQSAKVLNMRWFSEWYTTSAFNMSLETPATETWTTYWYPNVPERYFAVYFFDESYDPVEQTVGQHFYVDLNRDQTVTFDPLAVLLQGTLTSTGEEVVGYMTLLALTAEGRGGILSGYTVPAEIYKDGTVLFGGINEQYTAQYGETYYNAWAVVLHYAKNGEPVPNGLQSAAKRDIKFVPDATLNGTRSYDPVIRSSAPRPASLIMPTFSESAIIDLKKVKPIEVNYK